MSKMSSIFTVGLDHIKLCLVMGRHPLNNASFLPYKLQKNSNNKLHYFNERNNFQNKWKTFKL